MIGRTLAHYRVTAAIGAGGMGEVYRAGDSEALEQALLPCGYQDWFWHISAQHQTARVAYDTLLALAADRTPSLDRTLVGNGFRLARRLPAGGHAW